MSPPSCPIYVYELNLNDPVTLHQAAIIDSPIPFFQETKDQLILSAVWSPDGTAVMLQIVTLNRSSRFSAYGFEVSPPTDAGCKSVCMFAYHAVSS